MKGKRAEKRGKKREEEARKKGMSGEGMESRRQKEEK